ncbi:MAG: tetraacyldisaccharide 4'-kinase [Phycisphaerales bacterium]|nr:tetraacyldisaccharide 4'-kinase [Phycisphaerales bacterium]
MPRPIGTALAPFYMAVVACRNRRYDAGRGVVTLDRPVISVGNLSLGGTGKTPLVAWIVETLTRAGHAPCIAMRGYASRAGHSDEAAEYGARFTGVPVVARPNRVEGLLTLFRSEAGAAVDCVVLDDGFQHRRVARQLDIVLIDATRGTLRDRVLPAGWLREPPASLARAGHVVVTHAECADPGAIEALLREVARRTGAPAAVARHTWTGLTVSDGGVDRPEPTAWLRGRPALPVCAIGNPGPFLAACAAATGAPGPAPIVLPDHDPYRPGTLRRVLAAARSAGLVITTEKDWSKLARASWPCPVARARLGMTFDRGEDDLLAAILHAARRPPE